MVICNMGKNQVSSMFIVLCSYMFHSLVIEISALAVKKLLHSISTVAAVIQVQ
jgi:hypothetical protein